MLNRAALVSAPARVHPMKALTLAAMTAALVGCTGGPPAGTPGVTPSVPPTGSPQSTPSPALPSPTPTPAPTAPPTSPPSPGEGEISHPTGAADVILRVDQGGGQVRGWHLISAPSFSLYGDGTFILRPQNDPERPDGWLDGLPRFLHGRMTEEYVQALLRHALGAGRLLGAKDFYPQNTCADCGSTIFTINAAGITKTVTVDDLSEIEATGPDAVDRRGFAQLVQTVADLETRARAGELGEVVLYDPDLYQVALQESFGEPVEEALAWPWSHISVTDFVPAQEFDPGTLIVSRDDVALLTEVPSGGHPGLWVEDPEGTLWQVGIRPLLPDEIPADPPTDG